MSTGLGQHVAGGMWRFLAWGFVFGLTWSAALRGYMVELAGRDSQVEWVGTFVLVLLPGAVTGALLGLAEFYRQTGGRRGWRWLAAAPVLLAVTALLAPSALTRLVTTGQGGGAIGVVGLGLLLGFAISGRGPRWARAVCGVVGGAIGLANVLSGVLVDPELSPMTPRGGWVSVLVAGLLTVFVLACALPHRPVRGVDAEPEGRA